MKKIYENRSVYEATQERLKFIFEEFENVYVSFSGGKDSGLILNLCIDYIRKHNLSRKIGVLHQDFEAQYTHYKLCDKNDDFKFGRDRALLGMYAISRQDRNQYV